MLAFAFHFHDVKAQVLNVANFDATFIFRMGWKYRKYHIESQIVRMFVCF